MYLLTDKQVKLVVNLLCGINAAIWYTQIKYAPVNTIILLLIHKFHKGNYVAAASLVQVPSVGHGQCNYEIQTSFWNQLPEEISSDKLSWTLKNIKEHDKTNI